MRLCHRILPLTAALLALAAPILAAPTKPGSPAANRSEAPVHGLIFRDLSGSPHDSAEIAAHPATVCYFLAAQCPVSNVYGPRIAATAQKYLAKGVASFAVYSNRQETEAEVARSAKERALGIPVVRDAGSRLADLLGAKATPEAVVIDAHGIVRYRGRIDDNPVSSRVVSHDLANALDAVLAGQPVGTPRTLVVGCGIRRASTAAATRPGVPTYAHDIAPILRNKCEGCHRPGEVAPFSLQTYAQASAWAVDIKRYTQNGQMPPWKPVAHYGEFQDAPSRILTAAERASIAAWANAGAPAGNLAGAPPPRKFVSGWQLGEPDMVIQPSRSYHLAADGDDVYRNFVVKTNFTEDRYIRVVEVRPGNASVVHHVIAYVDAGANGSYPSEGLETKTTDGQPGYTSFGGPGFVPSGMMAGWAPGNAPMPLPEGVAIPVPKGARIALQVHYHKNGKPETDLTRLGIHFYRGTVNKTVTGGLALNFFFRIPPGDPHYKVEATMPITTDMHVYAVTPHMHLLGREIKVWATLPDQTERDLVWIKDWDFNWQNSYYLKSPIALPSGSKVHLTSYFDNSDQNPRNPNRGHLRSVGWGEQTTDEMCIAFIHATRDDEHLNIVSRPEPRTPERSASR